MSWLKRMMKDERKVELFNLSFTLAIVPQLWKQANISPIYKDGDTGLVTNNIIEGFIIICCWEVSRKDNSYCYI